MARGRHGLTDTILFSRWHGMRNRCYNKNAPDYQRYGALGVTICDEWLNDFKAFYNWSMANGFQESLTIDKDILCDRLGINPKIYSPNTCQWISREENLAYYRLTATGTMVAQYTIQGKYVASYEKIIDATKATGIEAPNISRAAAGKRSSAGGYQWLLLSNIEEAPTSITPQVLPIKGRPVRQIDAITGETLATFTSVTLATKALGRTNTSAIQKVCMKEVLPSGNTRDTAYGFRWEYI